MGRPSNKLQRRTQIMDALLVVMAKSGYENASIQAIGKEAGLASGLVHYHFKNKLEILVELIRVLNETAQTRYSTLKATASNATEMLEAFIDAALALDESANADAVAAWVMIGAQAIRQNEVCEVYQDVIEGHLTELQSLLEIYAKENDKTLSAHSVQSIAATVMSTIEGAYQLATTATDITPRNYAAKTLKAMLFALLKS